MLVVHAVWLIGGRLALWAEDSTGPVPPRRSGRPPRERPHPYAADIAGLAEALGELAGEGDDRQRAARPADPHRRTGGLAGTGPAELADDRRGPVTLAGWRVPALEYDADDARPVLAALAADDGTGDRGAGLRHLAELAGFAVDLVGRGRLLPGLTGTPVGSPARDADDAPPVRAVWRPLLTGADAGLGAGADDGARPAARAVAVGPAATADAARRRPGWSPTRWTRSPTPPPGSPWTGFA